MDFHGHVPVLYDEAVEALKIRPNGRYLDATFGRGGHSRGILESLGQNGRLLGLDKDPQAILEAQTSFGEDERFVIRQSSFADINDVLMDAELAGFRDDGFDGVLMDLGVSSPQLDDPERGFSFRMDGPLDMRMDTTAGQTALEWLNQISEKDLKQILKTYGEERYSGRVARVISTGIRQGEIETTAQLAEVIRAVIPRRDGDKDAATRSFQAIRIAVNRELEDIQEGLDRIVKLLKSTGRLVVISFHSLEDRIVKQAFRSLSSPAPMPRKMPIPSAQFAPEFRVVGKPIKPSTAELERNPRARSATLRVLEKCS